MPNTALQKIWNDNAGLVQLLGLCPLLAVTNTLVNGLVLGSATLFTVVITNTLVASLRHWIPDEVRLPIFVIIIGSAVGAIDLLLEAGFYHLHSVLGLFVPLIVTNCVIIARAEAFASRNTVAAATVDGLVTGSGFLFTLLVLGTLREIVGTGALFSGLGLLFGVDANNFKITIPFYPGFIPAMLPVGAFFVLALLTAMHKKISTSAKGTRHQQTVHR